MPDHAYSAYSDIMKVIRCYIDNCPAVYPSHVKNMYYQLALEDAFDNIMDMGVRDTPLSVLDRLAVKYDEYAHKKHKNAVMYSCMAAAIEDLIDIILTS